LTRYRLRARPVAAASAPIPATTTTLVHNHDLLRIAPDRLLLANRE
jgi:hypothetical protein